ncbi:MAG: hypothetical protein L3J42_02060, partial [Hydrogenimonas sp.]|nr:hypothetical protein [Hydrogenimonas sp.]
MKKLNSLILALVIAFLPLIFMTGCGTGSTESVSSLSQDSPTAVSVAPATTSLQMLDDESFNALSEEERIYVANKLYTTLFKGRDLSFIKDEISTGKFIENFRQRLYLSDSDQPDLDKVLPDNYQIQDGRRFGDPLIEKFRSIYSNIISTLYYTKLSKEYYDEWMAYLLGQTILFSPAWEVESVNPFPELISSNYNRLKSLIGEDKPFKDIVYTHMISNENWARFRSPEDNGREMP